MNALPASGDQPEEQRRTADRLGIVVPWVVVLGAVAFGLIELRSEATPSPYLNDSSIHEQMVRFALLRIRHGHLPLTSWYPYLGLGSPQFLHYQSLGAMLTGLLGWAIGPDRAYAIVLYLFLATWPISVYLAGRLFRLERWVCAVAAACAPFIVSAVALGYEQSAYIWIGYGVWTQLLAMWTLPLAWGFTWRALSDRRFALGAVAFIALTVGFHYETGYLAILPVLIWPFVIWQGLARRLLRALVVGLGSMLAAAWVIVPVVALGKWTSVNEFLQHTPAADSYGARRVLSWLFLGDLYDVGRWRVITLLVIVGVIDAIWHWRRDARARAVLSIWLVSLVLFFGRPTLGPLIGLLPGNRDLFLRRFVIGAHLGGLFLAGMGAMAIVRVASVLTRYIARLVVAAGRTPHLAPAVRTLAACVATVVFLAPAWTQLAKYDRGDARTTSASVHGSGQAAEVNALIAFIDSQGGGRTYAGLPTNWGSEFAVGLVPVFKYLAQRDVDEVGYTLRTASLMTDPEAYFDENNPADYAVFAVRYLILPPHRQPPLPATLVMRRGSYVLWTTRDDGYVQVVDTSGFVRANRVDIGERTSSFLASNLAARSLYPTVAFDGSRAPVSSLSEAIPTNAPSSLISAPGIVISERDDLASGTVRAKVFARREAVVLLKVSFDPGWTVEVDGRRQATEMLAPALVGVRVSAGPHHVVFRYEGFGSYNELFALAVLTLLVIGAGPALFTRLRRRARRARPTDAHQLEDAGGA